MLTGFSTTAVPNLHHNSDAVCLSSFSLLVRVRARAPAEIVFGFPYGRQKGKLSVNILD